LPPEGEIEYEGALLEKVKEEEPETLPLKAEYTVEDIDFDNVAVVASLIVTVTV